MFCVHPKFVASAGTLPSQRVKGRVALLDTGQSLLYIRMQHSVKSIALQVHWSQESCPQETATQAVVAGSLSQIQSVANTLEGIPHLI